MVAGSPVSVPSSSAGSPDRAAPCGPAATCQAVARCPARRWRDSHIHHRSPHCRRRLGSGNPAFTLRIALHSKTCVRAPGFEGCPDTLWARSAFEASANTASAPVSRVGRICQGGLEPGAGRHTKVRSHQRTITELGPKASEPWSRPDESRARLDRRSSALGCRSGGPSGSAAWGGRSRTCPAPPSRE
jgi:hypothetical protein